MAVAGAFSRVGTRDVRARSARDCAARKPETHATGRSARDAQRPEGDGRGGRAQASVASAGGSTISRGIGAHGGDASERSERAREPRWKPRASVASE